MDKEEEEVTMPTDTTKQQTVVLYPFPGVGHVVPMVELAKVFLRHGYAVTVVLVHPPPGLPGFSASAIDRIAASNPAISFHALPSVADAADDLAGSGAEGNPLLLLLQLVRRYNGALERFLRSIPRRRLHSLVVSMFTAHAAVDVAARLPVPAYTFFTSAAATLAVVAQLPAALAGRTEGLKALGQTPLEFLGVPPLPASHLMPEVLEHPGDELCQTIVSVWTRCTEADGVLVNTFESLEPRAVQALRDPRCVVVPAFRALPPVYCVGPLVTEASSSSSSSGTNQADETAERHQCLAWLDAQPERSVVFLCFGSRGALSPEQLREIAAGLENSGQRFLWVVRAAAAAADTQHDLDELLPDGFMERTKGRGLVVESWAPQVAVLRHPATGAFVTHCGWNSTLETITAGVPALCWPLYAEQMLNKVLVTVAMGIGVELEGYTTGSVRAEELEAKVRLVMESEEGRELRARVAAYKEEASAAMADGGSSRASFLRFLSDVQNLDKHASK